MFKRGLLRAYGLGAVGTFALVAPSAVKMHVLSLHPSERTATNTTLFAMGGMLESGFVAMLWPCYASGAAMIWMHHSDDDVPNPGVLSE